MIQRSQTRRKNDIDGWNPASQQSEDRGSTLSLPKGGGSLKGLNEKFSVDAFTGTASSSILIFEPAGRLKSLGGVSVSYNTGAGNGQMGMGWSVGTGSIKRRTDKGVPQYGPSHCTKDIFVAPGTDDLVQIEILKIDEWQVIRYRSRVEKSFSLIEQYIPQPDGKADDSSSFWRVVSKTNLTSIYGATSQGRIANPDCAKQIFEWKLQARFDDRGNLVLYEHELDVGEHKCRNFTASYLRRILYGTKKPFKPNSPLGIANQIKDLLKAKDEFLFEVRFDYDLAKSSKQGLGRLEAYETCGSPEGQQKSIVECPVRPDAISSNRSGFQIRTRRLCRRALVFHRLGLEIKDPRSKGYDGLVRSFEFDYEENEYASKLTSVTQVNYRKPESGESPTAGQYVARCMPPMEFVYAPMPDLRCSEIKSADVGGLPNVEFGTQREWTDINSDGAPGLLIKSHSGAWTYYRNRGEGRLASGEAVVASPTALTGSAAQLGTVQLMDLGADGSQDLVSLQPGNAWMRERVDDSWAVYRTIEQLPNIDFNSPYNLLRDINGNGLADVVVIKDDGIYWHQSLGERGFAPLKRLKWDSGLHDAPTNLISDVSRKFDLMDFSGDGLADIIQLRNHEVVYWPNLGNGCFGSKVRMENPPWFDHQQMFDPARIKFADADGAGNSDILYLGLDGIRCWRNRSGDSWSPEEKIPFPPISDPSQFSVIDLLANGTSCLVWTDENPADPAKPLRYIHLAGVSPHSAAECDSEELDCCHRDKRRIGQKPHLLIKSVNNMGGETEFFYTTSSKFAAADRDKGKPWITNLGFPVQVIERVERFDRITRRKTVEAYRYRHGYYDGKDREFRGFAYVEKRDTVSFDEFCLDSTKDNHGDRISNADASLHMPPVVTKTWYHTGASFRNESQIARLRREYYNEDPNAILLPDTQFEKVFCGQDSHEASRALKGSILRQEVYSEDSDFCVSGDLSSRPYSVSERSYTVRCLFAPNECKPLSNDPTDYHPRSVFMVFPSEQIDYQYERQLDDPRIKHQFTLEVDDWGDVIQSANVAYRRSEAGVEKDSDWLTETERRIQERTYITFSHRRYTAPIQSYQQGSKLYSAWYAPSEYEERTWELSGFRPNSQCSWFQSSDFLDVHQQDESEVRSLRHGDEVKAQSLAKQNRKSRRMIEQVRQLFVDPKDGKSQLTLGEIATPVLPGKSYKLAFDRIPELLKKRSSDQGYFNNFDIEELFKGFDGGGYKSSADIQEFQASKITTEDESEFRWALAPYRSYQPAQFFLPDIEYDGFGNRTFITYDSWSLLKQSVTDPLANQTSVSNDYRVLQPHRLSDFNESITDIHFDTHGLVIASAIEGHNRETGDYLMPGHSYEVRDPGPFFENPIGERNLMIDSTTTRILYDPLAYYRSIQTRDAKSDLSNVKPVWSCVLARQKHMNQATNPVVEVTFAFTDGFFMEGQTVRLNAVPNSRSVPNQSVQQAGDQNADQVESWLASGIRQLNNKGKPVREFEPFFKENHTFEYRKEGVSKTIFYDPLERVIGTLHPDHSWEKITFNAWGEVRWDRNDTVLLDAKEDVDLGGYFAKLSDDAYLPCWMDLQATAELQPTKLIGHGKFQTLPGASVFERELECVDPALTDKKQWHSNLRGVRDAFAKNHNPVFRKRRHLKGIIGRTKPNSAKVGAYANTPERICFDSLGKAFLAIEDNRTSVRIENQVSTNSSYGSNTIGSNTSSRQACEVQRPSPNHPDLYHTRTEYDVEGNQRAVVDALGRTVMAWEYNMLGNVWCTKQMDWDSSSLPGEAGKKVELLAIDGKLVAHWDERQHFVRTFYDALRRETRVEQNGQIAEQFVYGESQQNAKPLHLRGQLFQETVKNAGGAGRVTTSNLAFDWHNEPINQIRNAETGLASNAVGSQSQTIRIRSERDALGREFETVHDELVRETRQFNLAGQLEQIDIDQLDGAGERNGPTKVPVSGMRYNARGQRYRVTNGGAVEGKSEAITDFEFDPLTFRMRRTVTRSASGKWQDLAYQYDCVGNVLRILDSSDYQLIFGHDDLVSGDQDFTYDSIYRLTEATGREHPAHVLAAHGSRNRDIPEALKAGQPSANDATALVRYVERYQYDSVGNMLERQHTSSNGRWVQRLEYAANNNRLQLEQIGKEGGSQLRYDSHGNIVGISSRLSQLGWDFNDRLMSATLDGSNAQAVFAYNAKGSRTTRTEFGNTRIYFDAIDKSGDEFNVQLIDNAGVRLSTISVRGGILSKRYLVNNHVASTRVELVNQTGIRPESFEEHLPYGQTSFFKSTYRKRLRFTGKEKDQLTGFSYHTARYLYLPASRWASPDPSGTEDGPNRYLYVSSNPTSANDPSGNILNFVAGAAFGAALDVGAQLLSGKSLKEVDLRSVAVSAAMGATGVGIGNVVSKAVAKVAITKGAQIAVRVGATAVAGAVEGGVEQVARNVVSGEKATKGVGKAMAWGVGMSVGGDIAGESVKRFLGSKAKSIPARGIEGELGLRYSPGYEGQKVVGRGLRKALKSELKQIGVKLKYTKGDSGFHRGLKTVFLNKKTAKPGTLLDEFTHAFSSIKGKGKFLDEELGSIARELAEEAKTHGTRGLGEVRDTLYHQLELANFLASNPKNSAILNAVPKEDIEKFLSLKTLNGKSPF